MSDSVRLHRQQPTSLPCPWDSPGKNTGVGCHFLLQCMKVKNESEVAQSCLTLSDHLYCSLPGSSIHGIFQVRVLEWGAIAFSTHLRQMILIFISILLLFIFYKLCKIYQKKNNHEQIVKSKSWPRVRAWIVKILLINWVGKTLSLSLGLCRCLVINSCPK